jgi:hypothetical protein
VKTCRAKVTELEGNIQGVSNLFDNLKVECKTNKDQITKVSKICDKNQNDIKKVSTKLELVQANISTQSCNCEEDIESLKSTVLVVLHSTFKLSKRLLTPCILPSSSVTFALHVFTSSRYRLFFTRSWLITKHDILSWVIRRVPLEELEMLSLYG